MKQLQSPTYSTRPIMTCCVTFQSLLGSIPFTIKMYIHLVSFQSRVILQLTIIFQVYAVSVWSFLSNCRSEITYQALVLPSLLDEAARALVDRI